MVNVGCEHEGPGPLVQPGPLVRPAALSHPPENQAQLRPLALRLSPMVGVVRGGSFRPGRVLGEKGWLVGWMVLTA